MAASVLPEIGTNSGPCFSCSHSDCRETRQMSETVCPYCHNQIGYGNPFYETDDLGLVHALCHESAVEQTLAAELLTDQA